MIHNPYTVMVLSNVISSRTIKENERALRALTKEANSNGLIIRKAVEYIEGAPRAAIVILARNIQEQRKVEILATVHDVDQYFVTENDRGYTYSPEFGVRHLYDVECKGHAGDVFDHPYSVSFGGLHLDTVRK